MKGFYIYLPSEMSGYGIQRHRHCSLYTYEYVALTFIFSLDIIAEAGAGNIGRWYLQVERGQHETLHARAKTCYSGEAEIPQQARFKTPCCFPSLRHVTREIRPLSSNHNIMLGVRARAAGRDGGVGLLGVASYRRIKPSPPRSGRRPLSPR